MQAAARLRARSQVKQAAGWASHTLKEAAQEAAPERKAGGQPAEQQAAAAAAAAPAATESFDDEGEAAEAAAAAASGGIVDVTLFAPGRLLYVRPLDESVDEDKQHFELVDGKAGARAGLTAVLCACVLITARALGCLLTAPCQVLLRLLPVQTSASSASYCARAA